MYTMRALSVVAVAAGAAAEAGQWGHGTNHIHPPVVAPRDIDCTGLPKLCTDAVLLRGYETTLTYLCPETEGPSTFTVTTTATTTVTADQDLASNVPGIATSGVEASTSEQPASDTPVVTTSDVAASTTVEPTTTVTVQSTVQITITRAVTKVATSSSSSLPPPADITWSFSAVLPSDQPPPFEVKSSSLPPPPTITWEFSPILPSDQPSPVSVKTISVPPVEVPSIVASISALTTSASSSFDLFPSHTVSSSSSVASTSSEAEFSSVGHHAPPYANRTAISHTPGNLPTLNVREAKSTVTVTSTASVATETKKGQAGDSQASFIALFFGVLAATLLI